MAQQSPRPARRPKSRPATVAQRILRILMLGLGSFAVLGAGVFGAALYATRSQEGNRAGNAARFLISEVVPPELVFQGRSRVNVLLIGEDVTLTNRRELVKEFSRSDTNILISLDRLSSTAHLLSLPRDTKVEVPGEGVHKLNAAHRYGGPFLLLETIRANFGLQTDHYVKTNFHGFIELVDMVGGIDVDVERDMDYDDSWQDFHVHLKKGYQHLNGEQAHGYVRWRKSKNGDSDPRGDLGRVERQQKVIKILVRKALSPAYLPKLRGMMDKARQYLQTDLTDKQLLSLLMFMSRLDPASLDTATLPCDYTGFYMEVRREEAATLLTRMFAHTFDPTRLLAGVSDSRHLPGRRLADPQPSKLRAVEEEPATAPPQPAVSATAPDAPAQRPVVADPRPVVPSQPFQAPPEPAPPARPEPAPAPVAEPAPAPPPAPTPQLREPEPAPEPAPAPAPAPAGP